MGSGLSKRPEEHVTPPRASRKRAKESESPAAPPDPDRVSKAYAVVAMHRDVMAKGFAGFVADSFGTCRQALKKRHGKVTDEERVLLSEHGKSLRAASGTADLPAGSDAWLLQAERVRLGLAQRSLTRDEIKKLPKAAKRHAGEAQGITRMGNICCLPQSWREATNGWIQATHPRGQPPAPARRAPTTSLGGPAEGGQLGQRGRGGVWR